MSADSTLGNGGTASSTPSASLPAGRGRRGRRWVKALGFGAVFGVLGLGVLTAFAPALASGFVPGVVQGAAKSAIAGEVTVGAASLSWGGPQTLRGVELREPGGKVVAKVDAEVSAGLWALLRGSRDLGTVTVSGSVDLVKGPDGTTNLDRATAPAAGAKAGAGSGTGGGAAALPGGLAAKVVISGFDATLKEVDGSGGVVSASSLTKLRGEAAFAGPPAAAAAKADLTALVGDGKTSGTLEVKMSVSNFADAQGRLTLGAAQADVTVKSGGLPVALLDAAAQLKGLLVEALGATASVNIVAKGDAKAGTASIELSSPNASTSLSMRLADGALVSEKPGAVRFVSTAFLGRVPALKEALARAGVTVEAWPAFEATVTSLTLPTPRGGAGGGGGGGELDLRGVGMSVEVKTTAMRARLESGAAGAGAGAGGAPTAAMAAAQARARGQMLGLAPVSVSIRASDLAKGVSVKASTSATVDNQSAGVLALEAEAADMLDERGRLALGGTGAAGKGRITGRVSAERVASALAQPFLSGLDVPIDVATDIGPTVDVVAGFQTAVGGGGVAGAVDADVLVDSQRLRVTAPLRLAERVLTTREPVTVEMAGAGEAARRFLSRGVPTGQAPAVTLGGDPSVRIAVSEMSFPLEAPAGSAAAGGVLGRLGATVGVQIGEATVTLGDGRGGTIGLKSLAVEGSLRPGQVARAKVDARLSHRVRGGAEGAFRADADLALPGLLEALDAAKVPGQGATGLVPGMGALRVQGSMRASEAPMSLAEFAGGDGKAGGSEVGGAGASMAALLRGVVGERASVSLTLEPGKTAAEGQGFALAITGDGLSANVSGDLTAARARVQSLAAEATVRPETVRALLPSTDEQGRPLPQTIAMRAPARVAVTGQAFAVPLRAGTLTPEWASAGDATVGLTLREPLLVTGIPMGEQRLAGGMRELRASATVPLAMLDASAKPAKGIAATLGGTIVLDERQDVGVLSATVAVTGDRQSADVTATITGLDTAALDGVLGQPGLVSGALGETADVSLAMKQDLGGGGAAGSAAKPLRARVQVAKSPRLTTDPLEIVMDEARIALAAPAKVSWTIDPAWADRYVLKGTAEKPQAFRLIGPTAFSVEVEALAVSKPESAGDLLLTGPFKPGVFVLDVAAAAPRVQVVAMDQGAPGQPVTLEGVTVEARSAGGGAGNAVTLVVKAASVAGGGSTSQQGVTMTGTIKDLAASNGALDTENLIADLNVQAPGVPTALVDAVGGMNGRVTELLGPQLRASLTTTNLTRRPGGRGQVAVDVRSFRPTSVEPAALFVLEAPVNDGVIAVPAAKPLRLELAEFSVGERSPLIQSLGVVASMSKARLDAKGQPNPARVTSGNLRLPLGWRRGERQQLNGDIDVALGVVNYELRTGFASLIQTSMVKDFSRGVQQPPMKPFRVTIRDGVAEYSGVEIPIKVGLGFGEEIVSIPLSGKVNLVDETIDAEASLPLELVSSSVLSVLPIGLTGVQRDLLGFMEKDPKATAQDAAAQAKAQKQRSIRIPVRVYGPMSEPKFAVDVDLFGARSGNLLDELLKNPVKAIEGIQDTVKDFTDLFTKPKK